MKKLLALSAAILGVSAAAHAAPPKTNVYINGEVRAQTCTVDGDIFQNTVTLDPIKLEDLKSGKKNDKEFSVKLKACDFKSQESVYVAFDSTHANVTADGNLKNTQGNTPNTSTGVQIQIMNTDGTKINLADPLEAKSDAVVQRHLRASNGAHEFKFKAGYAVEQGATPTTGFISSSIPVTLQYQ